MYIGTVLFEKVRQLSNEQYGPLDMENEIFFLLFKILYFSLSKLELCFIFSREKNQTIPIWTLDPSSNDDM